MEAPQISEHRKLLTEFSALETRLFSENVQPNDLSNRDIQTIVYAGFAASMGDPTLQIFHHHLVGKLIGGDVKTTTALSKQLSEAENEKIFMAAPGNWHKETHLTIIEKKRTATDIIQDQMIGDSLKEAISDTLTKKIYDADYDSFLTPTEKQLLNSTNPLDQATVGKLLEDRINLLIEKYISSRKLGETSLDSLSFIRTLGDTLGTDVRGVGVTPESKELVVRLTKQVLASENLRTRD